jgi:transglutaminase-like putative cysteine protease
MLEPNGRNWAFALEMPQIWSGERTLRMGSDYQLVTFPGPLTSRLDYRVTSYSDYSAREPLTAGEIELFRDLPPDSSPRSRALVATWLTDNPSPQQVIQRAMDYLRSRPFAYTLTPPALGAQPVDEFLFETLEGFCEHYASAFAVLMRAAGLPARVVTGYQGGELNNLGQYYIIRQSDAHAWTEIWLAELGWTRVDPIIAVAPERVALGSTRGSLRGNRVPGNAFSRLGWVRSTMLAWDAINTQWQAWVVGYGPDLQRALLESLGIGGLPRAERWVTLLVLAVSATAGVLLVLSVYLAWRHRQQHRHDPAARCFAAFCRRLARCRVPPRTPSEAPEAFAARAQRLLPHAAPEIAAIAAVYLRARYEPDTDQAALSELRARVANFRPIVV